MMPRQPGDLRQRHGHSHMARRSALGCQLRQKDQSLIMDQRKLIVDLEDERRFPARRFLLIPFMGMCCLSQDDAAKRFVRPLTSDRERAFCFASSEHPTNEREHHYDHGATVRF